MNAAKSKRAEPNLVQARANALVEETATAAAEGTDVGAAATEVPSAATTSSAREVEHHRPTLVVPETTPTTTRSQVEGAVQVPVVAQAHVPVAPAAREVAQALIADLSAGEAPAAPVSGEEGATSDAAAVLQEATDSEESGGEEQEEWEDPDDYSFDEEDLNHIVEDILDPVMGMNHPDRMKVNSVELDWALDVRAAIESDPEVDNLSDFMYTQLALVCQQANTGRAQGIMDALDRARGLQKFRQDFDIADIYEEGCRALKAFVELCPRQYLAWTFCEADGTWISVYDMAKADLSGLTTEANLKAYFAGYYYLHHAWSPDLQTIRKGPIVLAECQGVEMSGRTNFRVWFHLADKFLAYYPSVAHIKHYHTSMFFNSMVAIAKQSFLTKEKAERYQVGLTSEVRLDSLFLVPNAHVATERMLHNMTECLKRRYDNQRQFSIPRSSIRRGFY